MNTQQAYITGFVKRASEYGVSQQEALELLGKFAKDKHKDKEEEHIGPWDADNTASRYAADEKLKGLVYNRKHHLGHYIANPFVGGPLTEAATRAVRRYTGGTAGDMGVGLSAAEMVPGLAPVAALAKMIHGGGKQQKAFMDEIHKKHLKDVETPSLFD